MKINPVNLSTFKGYDASPLKRIFVDDVCDTSVKTELEGICTENNIKLDSFYDCNKWAQDDKTIIESQPKPLMITNGDTNLTSSLIGQGKDIITCVKKDGFLTGGNTYIGKKQNGEKWILTGKKSLSAEDKEKISSTYNVKIENIYTVPKPNFHIDMELRPVGYPYILVNDYGLVDENLEKINDRSDEFEIFLTNSKIYRKSLERQYASNEEVTEALKRNGFIPIKIAGEYSREVNFLNAIVNKNRNGKMSYITNSSEIDSLEFYKKMQEMFEHELRQKVPNIEKTYFIKGVGNSRQFFENYMMFSLCYGHGGIHCMTLEEPYFETWA